MTKHATLDDAPELDPGTEFRFVEEHEEHLLRVEGNRWWLYSFSPGKAHPIATVEREEGRWTAIAVNDPDRWEAPTLAGLLAAIVRY